MMEEKTKLSEQEERLFFAAVGSALLSALEKKGMLTKEDTERAKKIFLSRNGRRKV